MPARALRTIRRARPAAARAAFRLVAAEPRFVIVTHGRTGSELLVSLLGSHPQIVCESEILIVRRFLPAAMVLRHSARARLRGNRAYGFKLLAHHARLQNPDDAVAYVRSFHDRGFRIIHLERRDWLQQAISSIRAAGSRYHYRRGDGVSFAPTQADPEAILAALWLIDEGVSFLRSALEGLPALGLVYEDDLQSPDQQARTVIASASTWGCPRRPSTPSWSSSRRALSLSSWPTSTRWRR